MKRADLKLMGALLFALLVLAVLVYVNTSYGNTFTRSLTECPQYCTTQCSFLQNNRELARPQAQGTPWCREQEWELSAEQAATIPRAEGTYKGENLGLICCSIIEDISEEDLPIRFFPVNSAVGMQTEGQRGADVEQ